jgi:hypothetical protein
MWLAEDQSFAVLSDPEAVDNLKTGKYLLCVKNMVPGG